MKDQNKTKKELINELTELRHQVDELEASGKERKQLEKDLQREHNLLNRITETSPAGITVLDREGKIIFTNPQAEIALGLTKGKITQRTYNDPEWRITTYDGNPFPDQELPFQRVTATGLAVHDVRHAIEWPDGRRVLLSVNAAPLFDDDGRVGGMVATVEDITERVRMEKELLESEEKYRKLVEEPLQGIIIAQGLPPRIIFANSAMSEILGYSKDELVSLPPEKVKDLIHPEDRPIFFQRYRDRLEGKPTPSKYEIRGIRKDGTIRWAELFASRIEYQGEPAVHASFVEITEQKRLEDMLEKERQELKLIIDSSPTIIFYKDKEGRLLRVNKAFAEALKMPEEDFLGKTVFDLYSTKIAQAMTDDDHEVLKSARSKLNIIEQYESSSGTRWVQTDKIPICDPKGIPVGLMGFAQDITERKQAEETLRESQELYQSLFEGVPIGLYRAMPSGEILDANLALMEILGYPDRESLLVINLVDRYVKSEDRKRWEALMEGQGVVHDFEAQFRRYDGTVIWIRDTCRAVRHDGGQTLYYEGAIQDITEHKQAEEAIRKSEEKYRTIFEESRDVIYITTREGTFTDINQSGLELFGYSKQEIMGLNMREVYADPNDRPRYQQEVEGKGFVRDYEIKFRKKDGTEIDTLVTAVVQRADGGGISGYQGIIRDITERKRAEKQLRESEERERQLSRENAIMAEIGRIISSTLNIDEVYEPFAEKVRELIPFDRISINIFDPRENSIRTAYVTGIDVAERLKGDAISIVGTLTEKVIGNRMKIIIQGEDQKKAIDQLPGLLPHFQAGIRSLMAIPMITQDEVIGALHFQFHKSNAYSDKDLRIAERVGNQIAGAIANAELFIERERAEEELKESEERAKQLSRENAIVAEIGQIVSSTLNINDVYEGFAEKVRELIPFDRITINIINSRENTIRNAYVTGIDVPGHFTGTFLPLAGGLTEEVMHTQTSVISQGEVMKQNVDRFPSLLPLYQGGIRSLMAIPIIVKDEVIGVFLIQSAKPNAYYEQDLRVADRVSHQIAGAIASAELFKERKRAEEQLRQSEEREKQLSRENAIVAEIGRIVSSTLNIDDVYDRFAEKVRELISFDRISILVFNPKDNTIRAAYVTGLDVPDRPKGSVIPKAGSLAEEVIRTRTKLLIQVEDPKKVTDWFPGLLPIVQAGIRSMVAIPMVTKDEVIGVLHLQSCKPNAYVDKDLTLAERVGNQIAGAIANADLYMKQQGTEKQLRESEERERQLSRENAIVAEIGRIVSSTLNIDDVYERFAEKVRELISFDRIGIRGINYRDHTFTVSYVTGLKVPGSVKGKFVPLAGTITEKMIHDRMSMLIQGEDLKQMIDLFPGLLTGFQAGIRSQMLIPLISKDEVIGILVFESTHPHAYSEKDLRVAERVGHQITGAIANAQLFTERQRTEEKLRASRGQLRALSAHLQSIREEERTLIAREIHDELGQDLTGLKMDLSWLTKRLPAVQEELVKKAESMSELIDTTIQSVRRISTELRPGVLDDLGLTAAIEWQSQDFQGRTGVQCEFKSTLPEVDLDRDRSTAVFRILQETLTNVARHANATKVSIYLGKKDGSLVLIVEDNGKGTLESEIYNPKSLGFLGMRERALVFGGKIEIRGVPEKGTTVVLSIPWQK